ncbi:glycosyltransferase, partial [Planococcus sp. SIMBA_143]
LQDLGFEDGENFISINEDNFKEKAFYYLSNELETQRIVDNGYEMVHKNHSTETRVKQLITRVKEIINIR